MANPPVTRRRIPFSVRGWEAELNGIQKFLSKAKELTLDNGQEWFDKQIAYYEQRYEDLMDNAPPILVKQGRARKARRGPY